MKPDARPTFGSLFAGIGGFDLGLERAGWECRWQAEWDQRCQEVLAKHWPDTLRYGDIAGVHAKHLPAVDLVSFGFPCQDLSVAGKREGLDGERSGLFWEAIRVIRELRERGPGPAWAVAENVPGLLSADGGAAMGRCLDALADIGAVVVEWAVLDAQHFGVPQRRRRVFIVACFDPAIECGESLLPVATRCQRHPSASDTEGTDAATGARSGALAYQCHGNNVGPMGTMRSGNSGLTGGVPFVVTERERERS